MSEEAKHDSSTDEGREASTADTVKVESSSGDVRGDRENPSENVEVLEVVDSLADSVGKVIDRMRALDRRQNLNSFVAYILFTVLLGGGFALLYQSRVGGLVRARDAAIGERDAARDRAEELQNAIGRRDSAAEAAYEYYSLIRDKRRTEVIAHYPKMEQLDLTPAEREFFARGVARARSEMVDAGYLAGLDAFRRGDYAQAITELERALTYEVEGQQAALMRYYLGVSQHRSGNSDKAIRNLELALAGRVAEAGVGDARYHLATAFEEIESLEDARKEYSKFASASPRSPLAPVARRKVGILARRIALAGARANGPAKIGGPGPAKKPSPVARPGAPKKPAPAATGPAPVKKTPAPDEKAPTPAPAPENKAPVETGDDEPAPKGTSAAPE